MIKRTPTQLFMRHVDTTAPDSHWLWTSYLTRGYGRFHLNGSNIGAHRAAWILFRGEVPADLQVHHVCYVKACVNPDHLELRTPRDNSNDVSPLRPPRKPKGPHKTRKAVCKHGHPMEGDNIAWTTRSNGRTDRYCRECARISNLAQYAIHAEARRAYARARYVPRHL